MDKWKGSVAVVTGANSGVGLATLRKLAECGLKVVGLDIKLDAIERLKVELRNAKIYTWLCDVTKDDVTEASFKWVERTVGPVDILVNCAGQRGCIGALNEHKSMAEIASHIDVNYTSVVRCTRMAIQSMQARDAHGYVVNVICVQARDEGTNFAVKTTADAMRAELSRSRNRKATDGEAEFFGRLRTAESEVFKWLRDEFHSYVDGSARLKREPLVPVTENGEDWYKNFQCRSDNKSCNGEISEQQQQQQHLPVKQLRGGKSESKEEANEKIMNEALRQQVLSGHRHYYHHDAAAESPNGDEAAAAAINRLLHAKTSMAARQNEIQEIELKHQQKHLTASPPSLYLDGGHFSLNENQLLATRHSSNGNFRASNLDTSLEDAAFGREKRSSGHRQRTDNQFSRRRNTLLDDVDEGGQQQQQRQQRDSNEPHIRVKRRDAINRHDGLSKSIDYEVDANRWTGIHLINPPVDAATVDDNLLSDEQQHVNTSAAEPTAAQEEMNNGNEKFSNDKSDGEQTANNDGNKIERVPTSAANNAKVMRKRDTGEHSLREHLRAIKGRHSVSDLISGELPNEIVKAAHNLVSSNELLSRHIKPHLPEPQFGLLKESSALKSSSQMSNLVSYLNELISDQVRMRSCIPLTPELQKFYDELMRKEKREDSGEIERGKKSVDDFLMMRRKFKRNAHHKHASRLELVQKCERVRVLHEECLTIDKCVAMRPSLIQYFKGHEHICEVLKSQKLQKKSKRSLSTLNGVTPEFAKLYNYKNYFLESSLE